MANNFIRNYYNWNSSHG